MLYPDVNNESTGSNQNYPVSPQEPQPPSYQAAAEPTVDYAQATPPPLQRDMSRLGSMPPRRPASTGLRTGAIIALTALLAVVFGVGLFAGWQFGRGDTAVIDKNDSGALQPSTAPQPTVPPLSSNNVETVREAVIAKVKPAIVQINVTTQQGSGLGSGVVIDKRGYIVTNNHVVDGAQNIQVMLSNGSSAPGQLVGTDPADDLAVVKINPPANIVVATFGDSSKLRVGQEVLAIGNPLGITQTVTNGIVSALNRSVSEGQGAVIPDAIQTDAPINPGNSGGALVDLQGNLIGIPTLTAIDPEFRTPASGVGFAIPAKRVQFVVPQIIRDGKVTHTGRAALGIRTVDVTQDVVTQYNLAVDHGILVANVTENGAAARGGLQSGDVIVQLGDTQVTDTASLSGALITKNPNETVSVKFYRGNQQMTVNVKLGELQAS